jgi:hypothetical protein
VNGRILAYFEDKGAGIGAGFIELPQKEEIRDDDDEVQRIAEKSG